MALGSTTFLGSLGFAENPFVLTNADEEPELQSYFVPPPYFPAVIGSSSRPKSAVVFAPRGGGKTAQKVMIEKTSLSRTPETGEFLCLTYDSFVFPDRFRTADASAEWHLINIVRLLVTAILIHADAAAIRASLSNSESAALTKCARNFLSDVSEAEFSSTLRAIRSPMGRVSDFYDKYKGQAVTSINAVAAKYELGNVLSIDKERGLKKPAISEYFSTLIRVCQKLGFESVYILVDRIDEASITQGDSRESFKFIESLLSDLHVLEISGAAFKFFLWDQVEPHYRRGGARPDRVPIYKINWSIGELQQMLSRRLEAYSSQRVSSLNELLATDVTYDLHALVATLAAGSPRDMIRMCRAIVDEQTRVGDQAGTLNSGAIERGISTFSSDRSNELFPELMDELLRIGSYSFTISRMANDVFRMTTQAMGRKIQTWVDAGAVVKSGELPNPGNRPQNLYSISEPKLAVSLRGSKSFPEVLADNMFLCPSCSSMNLVDTPSECYQCRSEIGQENSLSRKFKR
jgi:hypothetical protein